MNAPSVERQIAEGPPPDVSVIVVNWNAGDLLARCIASIPPGLDYMTGETIIVDNASTDGSVDHWSADDDVRLLRRSDNVGFAAGTNQGVRVARGRTLALLNPDAVCTPGVLAELARYVDAHPDTAAVGPRLLHKDGTLQRSAWRGFPGISAAIADALYLWKTPSLPVVRRSEVRPDRSSDAADVDHILGACMVIPRRIWDDVGPFDEGYFLFLEETDWCRRAKRAGYRIRYLPGLAMTHHGEHSVYQVPGLSMPHYYRSYVRFVRQSGAGEGEIAVLKTVVAVAIILRLALWSVRCLGPRRSLARGMLGGYATALRELRES